MINQLETVFNSVLDDELVKIIISNSSNKERISKIVIKPIMLKLMLMYQVSRTVGPKVIHQNYSKEELIALLPEIVQGEISFRQIEITAKKRFITILISKKGKVTIKEKKRITEQATDALSHNREKQYILQEGIRVPFLMELGVMTEEGKIVKSKYDKYKQINRFLEFIEDILPSLPTDREVTILDFGCGKSYLTFAMFYYLKELKGYQVKILGLDLKEDVINHCNELAKRYAYDGLSFLKGDIGSYDGVDTIDMVVTLHACDTATDYALYKAIRWQAKVILSVPCCQHELNKQMKDTPLEQIFKYGLLKERSASIITDAIRANLLEQWGYRTQILEFIDMSHTPKNVLIRAVKQPIQKKIKYKGKDNEANAKAMGYDDMLAFFGVEPTLHRLLKEYKDQMIESGEGRA